MKYVMLKRTNPKGGSQLLPVIFPNELAHADVAKALTHSKGLRDLKMVVDSAGSYDPVNQYAYGESTTLNIKSKPTRDSQVIVSHDYAHGLMEE
jgi:hypothetical protein